MTRDERIAWGERLNAIAAPVLRGTPLTDPASPEQARAFIAEFRDEQGHRRRIDPYVLGATLGVPGPSLPPTERSPDVLAWSALAAKKTELPIDLRASGPLVYSHDSAAIETATETELAVLQALWHRAGPDPAARRRALDAARWSVAHLQPDNATGHPWGAAVFIELWLQAGLSEARLYAESLIHNSMVAAGRPDRVSAVLLLDSSRLLLEAARTRDRSGPGGAQAG